MGCPLGTQGGNWPRRAACAGQGIQVRWHLHSAAAKGERVVWSATRGSGEEGKLQMRGQKRERTGCGLRAGVRGAGPRKGAGADWGWRAARGDVRNRTHHCGVQAGAAAAAVRARRKVHRLLPVLRLQAEPRRRSCGTPQTLSKN